MTGFVKLLVLCLKFSDLSVRVWKLMLGFEGIVRAFVIKCQLECF